MLLLAMYWKHIMTRHFFIKKTEQINDPLGVRNLKKNNPDQLKTHQLDLKKLRKKKIASTRNKNNLVKKKEAPGVV